MSHPSHGPGSHRLFDSPDRCAVVSFIEVITRPTGSVQNRGASKTGKRGKFRGKREQDQWVSCSLAGFVRVPVVINDTRTRVRNPSGIVTRPGWLKGTLARVAA